MVKQVPFINREDELNLINELLEVWGARRVVCINASGGIGKTRLLQELRGQHSEQSGDDLPLTVTEITDFDDHTFHLPPNLGDKIAKMLDSRIFEPYLRSQQVFREMESAGISFEGLNRQASEVDQNFVDCFNRIGAKKRVVLYLDTIDALEGKDIWNYLVRIVSRLENILLLIAGRNVEALGNFLQNEIGRDVRIVNLPPLGEQASESYLMQKQKLSHVSLESELNQKLLFLAQGRPILLDLAVEWRTRGIPFDWLAYSTLEEMKSLSGELAGKLRQEFEYRLVKHIADTRELTDWLILLMSIIYPLDAETIAELLELHRNESEALFKEALNYAFVKELPDGRISLHDEMRRMVNKHVWPKLDPDGDRQCHYLKRRIRTLDRHIKELRLSKEREFLEQTRWILKNKLLNIILLTDVNESVKIFAELFDETTRTYRFSLRKKLIGQMQQIIGQIPSEQAYEVKSRRVRYLLDTREYEQAKNLVTLILNEKGISHEQHVDMLIQSGNLEIRLGHLKQGISEFINAVQISKMHNLQTGLIRALTARGWAYRNLGDFDQALADYLEAYLLSLKFRDHKSTIELSKNMSYVYARKGKRDPAFNNCDAALKLCQNMGFRREMGATYSTMGRIYTLFDRSADALESFEKALNIFESENDIEWMSIVRCNRIPVFISEGILDKAEEEADWAFDNGAENIKPRIMLYQALIYRDKKETERSRKRLEECKALSLKIGDDFFYCTSFMHLMELSCEFGEFNRWNEFAEETRKLFTSRDSEMYKNIHGSCLRKIGDLAICNNNYDVALNAYKEGFLLIVENEFLWRYTIGRQIRDTEKLIRKYTPKVLSKLGRDLVEYWRSRQILIEKSPESLLTFQQWEWEGENL